MREFRGRSVLLTGLSGAGKTTLATAVASVLAGRGQPAEVLDGDNVRRRLWPELGLSPEDRAKNLDRMATVACMLARNGVVVLVSAIAPYEHVRLAVRHTHAQAEVGFVEVHVSTPLEVCRGRDTKGLYAKQSRGEIHGLTGVDAVYEEPESPDLRLDTSGQTVEESARLLADFVLPVGAVR
jgi:adenylylsulfate kinase